MTDDLDAALRACAEARPSTEQGEEKASRVGGERLSERQDLPRSPQPDESDRLMEKPLFIPLKAEFFDAFASGVKTEELRRYGPRWNERVCRIGRGVTLSRGYGKAARLHGRIWRFKRQRGDTFGSTYKASLQRTFGTLDLDVACLSIELEKGIAMKTCENCGSKVFRLGCVNCDEANYIAEQEQLTDAQYGSELPAPPRAEALAPNPQHVDTKEDTRGGSQ